MNDATTLAAIAEKYDAIPYDALPHLVAHPDHMAAVASMFGFDPARVPSARVLEVGCSDGANLLPMAATLPGATFVGCDIAPTAIRAANEAVAGLELRNLSFIEGDFTTLDLGAFDYIIAHGLYSWVPPAVRDALFALARRSLSPAGMLFVSYNTYPGAYVRRAAWEALRWHTRDSADRAEQLRRAREIAELLAEPGPTDSAADTPVRAEFQRIAGQSDSALYHDTLAETSEPVWFHAFVEHAGQHGLSYVAEALPLTMAGAGLSPRVRRFLASQGRIAREQYLDFARVRRFRMSLLCRSEAATDFQLSPARMKALSVSASLQLRKSAAESRYPTDPEGEVRKLLETLVEAAPAAMPVTELLERVRRAGIAPGPRPLDTVLVDAWVSGFAQLHVHPPRPAVEPSRLPRAFSLARWQAPRREAVTNLRHETIRLTDPTVRALLVACDGTRDRTVLAREVANGRDGSDPALLGQVDATLTMFAQCALLEPD